MFSWAARGLQFTQHFFPNQCILPIEDEMNLFRDWSLLMSETGAEGI